MEFTETNIIFQLSVHLNLEVVFLVDHFLLMCRLAVCFQSKGHFLIILEAFERKY